MAAMARSLEVPGIPGHKHGDGDGHGDGHGSDSGAGLRL